MLGGGSRPPSAKTSVVGGGAAMSFAAPPPLGAMFARPNQSGVPLRLRNEMQGLRYILFDETNYKNTDLSRFGPVYPKLKCTYKR